MTTRQSTGKGPDTSAEGGADAQPANRRFTDSIGLRGRGLKSDRRVGDRDRRIGITTGYSGVPRRTTLDRRSNLNERRHAP